MIHWYYAMRLGFHLMGVTACALVGYAGMMESGWYAVLGLASAMGSLYCWLEATGTKLGLIADGMEALLGDDEDEEHQ